VFKRRRKRSFIENLSDSVYPRGGWLRAASYVWHRLRRLPDPPHKIARGVAAGIFVSFTPFFGMHFLLAAALTWILNGNILAALIATFVGNPITFPFIATVSIELGAWMLDLPGGMPLPRVFEAFTSASVEIWANVVAMFTDDPVRWGHLRDFFAEVFLPYLVGGLVPGVVAGVIGYAVTIPAVTAYQNRRRKRLLKRFQKKIAEDRSG